MMRLFLTAAVTGLALAAAGCQGSSDNAATANDMMMNEEVANDINMSDDTAMNSVVPMMATDFVATVAGSDMFEIESGKLAQTMASNAELKAFGDTLVTEHRKSSEDLKTAASEASPPVTPPAAMPAGLRAKLDALEAAKGAEFDKLFVEQQKENHQQALDALRSYATNGDQQSLTAFASKSVPVVQGHLDKLNAVKL